MLTRIVALSLFCMLIAGCVECNAPTGKAWGDYAPDVVDDANTVKVWVSRADTHLVRVYFTLPVDSKYTHVVQELTLDNGCVLVESFRMSKFVGDRHTDAKDKFSRSMVVYAATVECADETSTGWAELPSNGLGVKTTTDGLFFNSDYNANHKRRGYILRRSMAETRWSIDDDGKNVKIGGRVIWMR